MRHKPNKSGENHRAVKLYEEALNAIRSDAQDSRNPLENHAVQVAPAPLPVPTMPFAAQAPIQASLNIDSTPSGADIEIDGAFVGNTPSTISIASGLQQIVVKKKGFSDWSKSLNVTSGMIHLNAELEQIQATAGPAQSNGIDPALSSAQNPATQEWGKAETDQIRAMVQAIRQCPAHINTDASSTISDGPPYNVTWDVTASQSVRAPYSGYIEFAVLRRVSCDQQPNQKQRLSDSCLSLMNLLVKPPLILRYEYDLSPDELNLSKILVRFDNETEWSNRSNVTDYCWERAAQPR